jgi:PKD repeat protein
VAYITVNSKTIPPVANFSGNPTTINENDQVNFADLSSNKPNKWKWYFQGGSPDTSSSQNPVITFKTQGQFNVKLVVYNLLGQDSMTKLSYIKVNHIAKPPIPNFSADKTIINEGDSIQFSDLSQNSPTSYKWTFEGGSPASSVLKNPKIKYNMQGIYFVKLVVANADGSDSLTKNNYLVVNHIPVPPLANFNANDTDILIGDSVSFTDLSSKSPTNWSWTFQNGSPPFYSGKNPPAIFIIWQGLLMYG